MEGLETTEDYLLIEKMDVNTTTSPAPPTRIHGKVWNTLDLETELLPHCGDFYGADYFVPHKDNEEYRETLLSVDILTTPLSMTHLRDSIVRSCFFRIPIAMSSYV